MKKEIFVVIVDNYFPELCKITVPALKKYADKINSKFTIIDERKFPTFPPTYEKLQIYELGKGNDFNILLDCDMLIRKDMYDVTKFGEEIRCMDDYNVGELFKDEIFKNRKALATNFISVPQKFHQIWKPLTQSFEEIRTNLKREFIIDEYCVSKNLIELGYNYNGILIGNAYGNLLYHLNINTESKNVNELLSIAKLFLE